MHLTREEGEVYSKLPPFRLCQDMPCPSGDTQNTEFRVRRVKKASIFLLVSLCGGEGPLLSPSCSHPVPGGRRSIRLSVPLRDSLA